MKFESHYKDTNTYKFFKLSMNSQETFRNNLVSAASILDVPVPLLV